MEDQVGSPVVTGVTPVPPVDGTAVSPPRSRGGWKWFVGAVVILVLAACACSTFVIFSMLGPQGPSIGTGDAIAVLYLDAAISGTGDLQGGGITPEPFIDQLEQAADDPRVKAIVIRIDSGGGTVAASQEIAMEVARIEKPIVVSVGDVAASGAYMVASQVDEIIAAPTSMIGSIGVTTQLVDVSQLLEDIGVDFTVITAGKYKDAGSPFRSLTATETALFEELIDFPYREFIRMVAEGRGLTEAEVEEMATGWVWSGEVAVEMGLIDATGTFNDAVDRAAELGGIVGEPEIITYQEEDFGQLLQSLMGIVAPANPLDAISPDGEMFRRSLPQ